jgi:hypothetical protein
MILVVRLGQLTNNIPFVLKCKRWRPTERQTLLSERISGLIGGYGLSPGELFHVIHICSELLSAHPFYTFRLSAYLCHEDDVAIYLTRWKSLAQPVPKPNVG